SGPGGGRRGRRGGDIEAVHDVERFDFVPFPLESRPHRAPEPALASGDDCLHGSSTTFATCCRDSINACARPASASGNVAPPSGSISPRAHIESSSSPPTFTTSAPPLTPR